MNNPAFMSLRRFSGLVLLCLLLVACSPSEPITNQEVTPTAAIEGSAEATEDVASTEGPRGPVTLRLWLPPSFSTFNGDPASTLLQERLTLFHEQYPNIQIDIRLKTVDGSGSMLDSWSYAAEAAPLALPDVAL